MSLYDAAKDAVKLAQKLDNIELVQELLDVQRQALDMQEKQQQMQSKINSLEAENQKLLSIRKYVFADGKNYFIDPESPTRKLCPICTPKLRTAVPLYNSYCVQCKGQYH